MAAPAKGLEGVKGTANAVGSGVSSVGGVVGGAAGGLISLPGKTIGVVGGAAKKLVPKKGPSKKRVVHVKGDSHQHSPVATHYKFGARFHVLSISNTRAQPMVDRLTMVCTGLYNFDPPVIHMEFTED